MKKFIKITVLLCILITMAACGTGGGGNEPAAPAASNGGGNGADVAAAPAEASGENSVVIFHNGAGFDTSNWGHDVVSRTIIEQTGIDITWEVNATADDTRINLMIASGDLPDLVYVDRREMPARTMMSEGLVYSWEYVFERYSPATMTDTFMTRNYHYLTLFTDALYTVPSGFVDRRFIDQGIQIMQSPGYYIRRSILDAIGNPRLETLDDLENVLRLAVEYDPTISNPLFLWNPVGNGWDANGLLILYRSMGGRGTADFFVTPDNRLNHIIRDPLYKETLMFVNRLFNDGLISHNTFMDGTVEQEAINVEGSYVVALGHLWRSIVPHDTLLDIEVIPHLVQPGVVYYSPVTGLNGEAGFFIPRTNQNLPVTARFLSYLISDEGQGLMLGGIYGEHWEWGGPDNNWIMLIGEGRELMDQGWSDWVEAIGTYRYMFAGYRGLDSAFAWGLAADNEFLQGVYSNNIGTDASEFEAATLDPESPDGANLVRVTDMKNHFIARIAMAPNQEAAEALFYEMVADMEAQGLDAIEAAWTTNFQNH